MGINRRLKRINTAPAPLVFKDDMVLATSVKPKPLSQKALRTIAGNITNHIEPFWSEWMRDIEKMTTSTVEVNGQTGYEFISPVDVHPKLEMLITYHKDSFVVINYAYLPEEYRGQGIFKKTLDDMANHFKYVLIEPYESKVFEMAKKGPLPKVARVISEDKARDYYIWGTVSHRKAALMKNPISGVLLAEHMYCVFDGDFDKAIGTMSKRRNDKDIDQLINKEAVA